MSFFKADMKNQNGFTMDKNMNIVKSKIKQDALPEKEFCHRESLLTEMYKNPEIKTLYNICVSILICLFLNSVITEYITKGTITLGLRIIYGAFNNFHQALAIWFFMLFLSLFAYIGLKTYAHILHALQLKSSTIKLWNQISFCSVIIFYLAIIIIPTYLTRRTKQPIASSIAIIMEQVRFLMKSHAFIRSNIPNIQNYKVHSEQKLPMPKFGHFLYFIFVPTLIYRETYPKTKEIRWGFVTKCFFEVILTVFYMAFVIEKFFMSPFENTCLQQTKWSLLLSQIFDNALPGLLLLLCSFYVFQHSWQNFFAELLKFGDRLFYKDWWTSTTYARYFRTWNIIVHDWLYTYIYKDIYENVFPGNKYIARFLVFFISAVFHEYILSFSLQMFFPVMFIQFFLIGSFLTFIKNHSSFGNIFLWFSFELGQGIMVTLYAIELYARYNCPYENHKFTDYFIPRMFNCNCY